MRVVLDIFVSIFLIILIIGIAFFVQGKIEKVVENTAKDNAIEENLSDEQLQQLDELINEDTDDYLKLNLELLQE